MQIQTELKNERLYEEYLKWRETGHEITYQQWLEINLEVERDNHRWMVDQWKTMHQNMKDRIRELSNVGLLFDGHDECNEFTHVENEKLLTAALDQIYNIVSGHGKGG